MHDRIAEHPRRTTAPWNRGKLIGPKPPLKAKEIWSIRVRLQILWGWIAVHSLAE
jgi:hypothetical protein